MNHDNICRFCAYSVPQKNSCVGLVDCPLMGYGNAYQRECSNYQENPRLAALKKLAVEAIKEFDALNNTNSASAKTKAAAARSVAMQEAFAAMLDVSYDDAAEYLREEADRED